jgi:hypothetical protein
MMQMMTIRCKVSRTLRYELCEFRNATRISVTVVLTISRTPLVSRLVNDASCSSNGTYR